jgi:predicted RNA-binding Zn-ribbon protein involved in translation (DUF1610 family)
MSAPDFSVGDIVRHPGGTMIGTVLKTRSGPVDTCIVEWADRTGPRTELEIAQTLVDAACPSCGQWIGYDDTYCRPCDDLAVWEHERS